MKKRMNLKRKVGIIASFMVAVMCLSSVFTFLLDTSLASGRTPIAEKGFTLSEADKNSYDFESNLNPDKVLSTKQYSDDDEVLVIIELDDNSLGSNYATYGNAKYSTFSDYINSDVAQSYVANMKVRQETLYNRLKAQYDIEFKYSYSSLFNAFSAYVRYGDIKAIEGDERVYNVILSESYGVPQTFSSSQPNAADVASNVVKIYEDTGIYDTRGSMNNGLGTIVAVLDTGLDYLHTAFLNTEDIGDGGRFYLSDIEQKFNEKDFAAEALTEGLTAKDVYISDKVPFAYDYADKDADVYPTDLHGTHVAGIIAGHDDVITGAAPGAQLAIMKVFSNKGDGSEEADIWAAIEDCVNLDVDVINMSLGLGSGFARDKDHLRTNEIYNRVLDAGINLIVAAGNDFSNGFGSPFGLNLASNPDSATVGSPSSFGASLSVASISGVKTPYMVACDSVNSKGEAVNPLSLYYYNSNDYNGEELEFLDELLGNEERKQYEYVVVPGLGTSSDYAGLDVRGKIAIVKRGIDTFVTKIEVARAYGAAAVIVRNHLSGVIRMSLGNKKLIPSCSIKMDVGDELYNRSRASSAAGRGDGGIIILDKSFKAGPFMSEFSGWGPLPNLELKPEITAHGGDITSADIGGGYATISGTSMAAPNFAGIAALLRQHLTLSAVEYDIDPDNHEDVRTLVNQLFMSTATIAVNEFSDPYSPRKQGAGLADLKKAEDTSAYLYVKNEDGTMYDKTKISAGDDPERTGVYELEFYIRNLSSNRDLSYVLDTIVMTEGLSSDGKTVTEIPVVFKDTTKDVQVTGDGSYNKSKSTVTVKAYSSAKINVSISLSKANKKYLDETFVNGMYVEGYVTLKPTATGSSAVDLNIPYLAFYGDWTDAPMLDKTVYETSPDEINDSLQDHEKNRPAVKPIVPYGKAERQQGNRTYEYYFPLGTQIYLVADQFEEVPTEEDKSALSLDKDGLFMLWGVGGLLRNAKTFNVKITNAYTGNIMIEKAYQNGRKSSMNSAGIMEFLEELDVRSFLSEAGVGFVEGGKYSFEIETFLDWGDGKTYGNDNKFAFDFYIDSVAPEILDVNVRIDKDRNFENVRKYLEFDIYDAHYAATLDLMYYNPYLNSYTSVFGKGMMPLRSQRGGVTRATVEVTDCWDYVVANNYDMMIMLVDYAWNQTYQYLNIKESYNAITGLSFKAPYEAGSLETLKISTFEEYDLRSLLNVTTEKEPRLAWDEDYFWQSDNPSVVSVDSETGKILGLAATTTNSVGITVSSVKNPGIRATIYVEVSSHNFANRDKIYPSKIQLNHSSLTLPTGSEYVITADVSPHKITDPYRVLWTSNSQYNANYDYDKLGTGWINISPGTPDDVPDQPVDTTKATISVGGIFKEELTGIFRPSIIARVQVWSDDKNDWVNTDILTICYIAVPQTFEVNYHILDKYNGSAEFVEIPKDMEIETIGSNAFTGNTFVKEIVVPEGVKTINETAFAYTENLEKITFPSSLVSIGDWAFSGRNPKKGEGPNLSSLREVIIDETEGPAKLRSIGERAFAQCENLESFPFASVVSIGDSAFLFNYKLTYLDLSMAKVIGEGAFYECSSVTDIKFADGVDIGDYAFYGNKSLYRLEIPASRIGRAAFYECVNATYDASGRIIGIDGGLEEVKFVGEGPIDIGLYAFTNSMNLGDIIFGDTVIRSIGDYAFAATFFLSSVTLPNGLERIGEGVFSYCSALTDITIPNDFDFSELTAGSLFSTGTTLFEEFIIAAGHPTLKAEGGVVYAKDGGTIVYVANNVKISEIDFDGVETIAPYAFAYNTDLVSINLSNVKSIGKGAFANCSNLTTVTGLQSVGTIGDDAFNNCTKLATIDLSESANLTSIGAAAFSKTAIASITLPAGITTIAANTFYDCNNLITVTALGAITEIGEFAFVDSAITNIDLSDVIEVGEGAFMSCTNLGEVDLSSAVTIHSYAFQGCNKLTLKSNALASAVDIGAYAFGQCAGLETIELPQAKFIGAYAFSAQFVNPLFNETEAEDPIASTDPLVIKPNSTIESSANLESVSMPKVELIGEGAFRYTNVTEINLPASIEYIMPFAFSNCALLESIEVEGSARYFSYDGVLYEVADRKNPVFDSSSAMIGYTDNSLQLVAYPAARPGTETIIYNQQGQPVTYLSYSVRPGTVRIEAGAFIGSSIEHVDLPFEIMSIGHEAFLGCDNLVRVDFHSHSAPAFETVITSVEVTRWSDVPAAYSYAVFTVVTPYFGNFVFSLNDGNNEKNVDIYYPANGQNYTSHLYKEFFKSMTATAEYVLAVGTQRFIDSVNALPVGDDMDWHRDKPIVDELVKTRNLLASDQAIFVSSAVDQKLEDARQWIANNQPVTPDEEPTGCKAGCGTIVPFGGSTGGMIIGGGLMMMVCVALYFVLRRKSKVK